MNVYTVTYRTEELQNIKVSRRFICETLSLIRQIWCEFNTKTQTEPNLNQSLDRHHWRKRRFLPGFWPWRSLLSGCPGHICWKTTTWNWLQKKTGIRKPQTRRRRVFLLILTSPTSTEPQQRLPGGSVGRSRSNCRRSRISKRFLKLVHFLSLSIPVLVQVCADSVPRYCDDWLQYLPNSPLFCKKKKKVI